MKNRRGHYIPLLRLKHGADSLCSPVPCQGDKLQTEFTEVYDVENFVASFKNQTARAMNLDILFRAMKQGAKQKSQGRDGSACARGGKGRGRGRPKSQKASAPEDAAETGTVDEENVEKLVNFMKTLRFGEEFVK